VTRASRSDNDGIMLLQNALDGTAQAATPHKAAIALLDACIQSTSATAGRIYLLDLGSAVYRPYASLPSEPTEEAWVRAGDLPMAPSGISSLEDVYRLAHPDAPGPAGPGIVVYAFRGNSCVGGIRLDGIVIEALSDDLRRELAASASLLVTIYENRFAFDLLGALPEPLDFSKPEDEFLADISFLIAQSSGMEYVALRERDGDRLRCIALWGFDDKGRQRGDWDLEPIGDYWPFERALQGHTVAVSSMTDPSLDRMREHDWVAPIRSFIVAPIRVGSAMFGVLSVAARCEFEYAELERRGIESIANGIGVSITNFRTSHTLSSQIAEWREAAAAIANMEIARAAKHEARGLIDNTFWALRALDRSLAKKEVDPERHIAAIRESLAKLNRTIDKLSLASRAPKASWENPTLFDLWEEARRALAGQIQERKISVVYRGPRTLTVRALPDWLRQVFLNLILNSIDAFQDTKAKQRGRLIELAVDSPPDKSNEITMTYTDNATGIQAQRLQAPPGLATEPVRQLVFEPGVTSKQAGTGMGLWLVRHILAQHDGSIDLLDHRNGVTFAIRMPRHPSGAH
jgi:signal transduction histidine kinase